MNKIAILKRLSLIFGSLTTSLLITGTAWTTLGVSSAQGAILIDNFRRPKALSIYNPSDPPNPIPVSDNQSVNFDPSNPNPPDSIPFSEAGAFSASILGGYRDLQLTDVTSDGRPGAQASAGNSNDGALSWINDGGVESQLKITWDGNDNSPNIDYLGLGGVDLTQGNTLNGILFQGTTDLELIVTLYIYTSATQYSTATLNGSDINANVNGRGFFAFNDCGTNTPCNVFTATAGGGADFSNVGAIQLLLDGNPGVDAIDATIQFIQADTDIDQPPAAEIPEPTSVIGLFVFGALGAGSALKRSLKQKSK